jgi:hypothetical protein
VAASTGGTLSLLPAEETRVLGAGGRADEGREIEARELVQTLEKALAQAVGNNGALAAASEGRDA